MQINGTVSGYTIMVRTDDVFMYAYKKVATFLLHKQSVLSVLQYKYRWTRSKIQYYIYFLLFANRKGILGFGLGNRRSKPVSSRTTVGFFSNRHEDAIFMIVFVNNSISTGNKKAVARYVMNIVLTW